MIQNAFKTAWLLSNLSARWGQHALPFWPSFLFGYELTAYYANATATNSDFPVDPLTFALVAGPASLTVSSSGAISWTPTEARGPRTNIVTISVTDTNPPAVNAKSLSVNIYRVRLGP